MAEAATLSSRIKAEFDASAQRVKTGEQERVKESRTREARLAQFSKTCDDLKSVWRPRLEAFAEQFGEQVKVTPQVQPEQRQATVAFLTDLANMTLRLSVATDSGVTKLVLDYDLLIIPIFFDYERHARLEMPLDKIDKQALGEWIDDRLVACVKAFLSVQENELYLRRAMVEDPITKAKFLRKDAAATLEHKGQTIYFSSQDSLQQYKARHEIKA